MAGMVDNVFVQMESALMDKTPCMLFTRILLTRGKYIGTAQLMVLILALLFLVSSNHMASVLRMG